MKNIVFIAIAFMLMLVPFSVKANTCAISTGQGLLQDVECDRVPDIVDNCPGLFNPEQTDANGDSVGDVCEQWYGQSVQGYSGGDYGAYTPQFYPTESYTPESQIYGPQQGYDYSYPSRFGGQVVVAISNYYNRLNSWFGWAEPYKNSVGQPEAYPVYDESAYPREYTQGTQVYLPGYHSEPQYSEGMEQPMYSQEQQQQMYEEQMQQQQQQQMQPQMQQQMPQQQMQQPQQQPAQSQAAQPMTEETFPYSTLNTEETQVKLLSQHDVTAGGAGVVYPLRVANKGGQAKQYSFVAFNVGEFGTYRFDPGSVVIIQPGEEKTIYLYVQADATARRGEHTFTLRLESGSEQAQAILRANIFGEEARMQEFKVSDRLGVILLTVLVLILLAGLVLILSRRKTGNGKGGRKVRYSNY